MSRTISPTSRSAAHQLRPHFREDALDPQVVRHGLGGAPVVAGHHGDRNPGLFESGDEHPGAWRRCCIGTAFRGPGTLNQSPAG